ncbi:hypothetical protein [Stenotrophobium rhamnosiphilum]|uniref:Uncharacterized protein n=1 Tax=Stenotrophobium rhamnosiphilum TaxID=2029166 RepID=A0A2T5MCM3_9GAMM|nr:hypothetical protein [Stenotrophobium rhamnosiphilum]PTU30326.1 hypothetical protein CJD38_15380 [Stenotrophobium rhamnosiphilum]
MKPLITHKNDECAPFFQAFIRPERKILFIGTLGFNDLCLTFPRLLAQYLNVDYLFLIEERPDVAGILKQSAERNRVELTKILAGRKISFESIKIVADDTANVAGRNATKVCEPLIKQGYTDVFVDASAASRGVCFPVVKQAYENAQADIKINAHVVMAGRAKEPLKAKSMSSDTPHYIHGFHGRMGTDELHGVIKLWIPQLSEGSIASLERIHRELRPDESCPILPFPVSNPRRGDVLLREFERQITSEWDVNLLDIIYAHETDPTDVCRTIARIHKNRLQAFERSTFQPTETILSPAGSRIGSVGMVLAALKLDLPIMYEESIGYSSEVSSLPDLSVGLPEHLWHVWIRP